MNLFSLPAPAKLNLYLHITGRRDDGYHLLHSGVTFLSLCDRVSACLRAGTVDTLAVRGRYAESVTPLARNSCLTALHLYRRASGDSYAIPPLHITIEKHIPVQAGLGGGSADAAAMLRGLQTRFPLPSDTLHAIALQCGADVPACLTPETDIIMRGIGEILEPCAMPLLPKEYGYIILYTPGHGASTPEIFARLRESGALEQLTARDTAPGSNDLTAVTSDMLPVITHMLERLRAHGARYAGMTGSGSAVFGVYRKEDIYSVAARLNATMHGCDVYPCIRFTIP